MLILHHSYLVSMRLCTSEISKTIILRSHRGMHYTILSWPRDGCRLRGWSPVYSAPGDPLEGPAMATPVMMTTRTTVVDVPERPQCFCGRSKRWEVDPYPCANQPLGNLHPQQRHQDQVRGSTVGRKRMKHSQRELAPTNEIMGKKMLSQTQSLESLKRRTDL